MYHSQNLNEDRSGNPIGSMLWHGRAWLRSKRHNDKVSMEWCFGRHATSCNIGLRLFHGEGDDGIMIHFCLPWLFSVYLSIEGVMRRGKECQFGAAIHNNSAWLYTGCYTMESNSKDPWWRKAHSWSFPWELNHHKTEILDAHGRQPVDQPFLSPAVFTDISGKRSRFLERYDERKAAEKSVSKDFPYRYVRKNGEVQERIATVHVTRMTWRMKWWPLLPFKKVRTSIDIAFNEEIGEGVGSWKGGTTGCGYDIRQMETPEDALRRMERDRKFGR